MKCSVKSGLVGLAMFAVACGLNKHTLGLFGYLARNCRLPYALSFGEGSPQSERLRQPRAKYSFAICDTQGLLVVHPHGGANTAADVVAKAEDGAVGVDDRGVFRTLARRPQPPASITVNVCTCSI